MNKRIIKKIQKAKTLSVKTTSKHSAEESKRVVSDKNIKKVESLTVPKKVKIGKKAARKTASKKKTAGAKLLRTKTAQTKRAQKRVVAQEQTKKLPPPPIPEGGKEVIANYRIHGDIDGTFDGIKGQHGMESALNRISYENPEIAALIQEYKELVGNNPGDMRELGRLFVEYYFDPRKDKKGKTQYLSYDENLWAIYESGAAQFIVALKDAIAARKEDLEEYDYGW